MPFIICKLHLHKVGCKKIKVYNLSLPLASNSDDLAPPGLASSHTSPLPTQHWPASCFLHLRDLSSISQRLEAELGNHTLGLKCQELRALVKFLDL